MSNLEPKEMDLQLKEEEKNKMRTELIDQQREINQNMYKTVEQRDEYNDEITPQERERIEALKENIVISDALNISQFGVNIQQKLGNFSDRILENVASKNTGEVGELLDSMLNDLKEVDTKDYNKKQNFISKLFKKAQRKTSELLSQYQSVSFKLNETTKELEQVQMGLKSDVQAMSDLANQNLQYGKAVNLYIIAGEEKLEEIRRNLLPKIQEKAQDGTMESQQALQRLSHDINRLEKRIADLQVSKTITIHSAHQIDLIRNNSIELIEKIQSSISNVVPLWKNQITIALSLRNQRNAQMAQEAITNSTNELLKTNSEMLKVNTLEIAKQAERGIVDVETLEITQRDLIETIQGTLKIQQEGSIEREKSKQRMVEMRKELQDSLNDLAKEAMKINEEHLNRLDSNKSNYSSTSSKSNSNVDYLNI